MRRVPVLIVIATLAATPAAASASRPHPSAIPRSVLCETSACRHARVVISRYWHHHGYPVVVFGKCRGERAVVTCQDALEVGISLRGPAGHSGTTVAYLWGRDSVDQGRVAAGRSLAYGRMYLARSSTLTWANVGPF